MASSRENNLRKPCTRYLFVQWEAGNSLNRIKTCTQRVMRAFIGSAFFLLAIGPAYANAGFAIAWQFGRLPLVPVALLIELPFLVFYFGMSWTRATIADLSMNLASAIVGFAIMFSLQPFWGFPNTFQLQVAWVLGIAAFNSVIEAFVLRAGFSERIDKTRTAALLIANIASSAIIMWGLPSGNFNDKTEGVHPIGGVALAPDGALYGVTTHGGFSDRGVVFKLTPPSTEGSLWLETILHSFEEGAARLQPHDGSGLVLDNNGNLYGALYDSRAYQGAIFKLAKPQDEFQAWRLTIVGNLPSQAGRLIVDASGALYGATLDGSVVRLTPPPEGEKPWAPTILHKFSKENLDPSSASLVLDAKGILYGKTNKSVFKLEPPTRRDNPWAMTVLQTFPEAAYSRGDLIFDNKGTLFVAHGNSVYALTLPGRSGAKWTLTVVHRTDDRQHQPRGLILDTQGALWGLVSSGGNIFKLAPAKDRDKPRTTDLVYVFGGNKEGSPDTHIVMDKSGALYGTTTFGGVREQGSVFKLAQPSNDARQWTLTTLHSFSGRE